MRAFTLGSVYGGAVVSGMLVAGELIATDVAIHVFGLFTLIVSLTYAAVGVVRGLRRAKG